MKELEIMQRAKTYMDKLANGINPLDDTTIPENDIVNNVRLSRCFLYVSDILKQVIENGGVVNTKRVAKENFYITFEQIQKFSFSDTPIPISEIAKRINSLVENENMKKITHKHLTAWLISIEMLTVETGYDGKTTKKPTPAGNELGITVEIRTGFRGDYTAILYNRTAQQFIVDNIDAVMGMMYAQ